MKRKILALIIVGEIFHSFSAQAAARATCDHTNIHSFDTTSISEDYYHWHDLDNDGVPDWCHATTKTTFTTYVCSDCGEIVYIIDKDKLFIHAKQ